LLTCLTKIPKLISRIIKLVHVYYRFQVFKKSSPDLHLCDIQDPALLASQLCLIGHSLYSGSDVLPTLIAQVPEFMPLILKGIEFDPQCWEIVTVYLKLHAKHDRPNALERVQHQTELINLQNYRAHHFACYLLVPIWVWAVDASPQVLPDSYRSQAFDLLVKTTSSLPNILLIGYSPFITLSESRMVERQCERWVNQGGFPALLMATVYFPNPL
jgi:hypothetical protein